MLLFRPPDASGKTDQRVKRLQDFEGLEHLHYKTRIFAEHHTHYISSGKMPSMADKCIIFFVSEETIRNCKCIKIKQLTLINIKAITFCEFLWSKHRKKTVRLLNRTLFSTNFYLQRITKCLLLLIIMWYSHRFRET